ncbi:MAG: tetraacyldisaccharide 4'-kinase [Rikenellaceae bacterium]|nr:tetraacyldisaccharide 4'-kinase [Rikenellaceae bacterium]
MLKLLAYPISWLFRLFLDIRHKLFDAGQLKSVKFPEVVTICVGNLTVGGTGKTPFTEMLVESLRQTHRVAVLSRGYGRRTNGFIEVTTRSSYKQVGDEPKQMKLKFPDTLVVVCEKRVEGVRRIMELYPDTEVIILDDAFQHRYIEPTVNIVLMDYNRPIYEDSLLPVGDLRDLPSQLPRAHFVCVTKCADTMTPIDMRVMNNGLKLFPYQNLYFTRMINGSPQPIFSEDVMVNSPASGSNVMALAAIGNPQPFLESLSMRYKVVDQMLFRDHHPYNVKDMAKIEERLASLPEDTLIITTEKDAVKLTGRRRIPQNIRKRLFFVPVQISFVSETREKFLNQLENYVRKNQTDSLLYTK